MSDSVVESKLSADGVDALQTTAGDILKNARQSAGLYIGVPAGAVAGSVLKFEDATCHQFSLVCVTGLLFSVADKC